MRIAQACVERGITPGIHANSSLAAKHVAAGYRMITVFSDIAALGAQAQSDLRIARDTAELGVEGRRVVPMSRDGLRRRDRGCTLAAQPHSSDGSLARAGMRGPDGRPFEPGRG